MTGQQTLEFLATDESAGFRLKTLELYNWGTFHDRVWSLEPEGRNILVTGDIGSGKSTLIDAITTLLVPPNRIVFNKAAGADKSERSLRTYVLGYYKSERSESGLHAKPVSLRGLNDFSVILGVFANKGFSQTVTLAQVFFSNEHGGQPERFYVVAAGRQLSVTHDFSRFKEKSALKKSLKASEAIVFDSFTPYCAEFKRLFGIETNQALELFNQTVSMKSVGNLTSFVREHMLQDSDVKSRIENLLGHYDNLNRAHEMVLKAREQIRKLGIIVEHCDRHDETSRNISKLCECREGLRFFIAGEKLLLLDGEDARLKEKFEETEAVILNQKCELKRLREERDSLKHSIVANGGDRLEKIRSTVLRLEEEKKRADRNFNNYRVYAEQLHISMPDSPEQFAGNRARLTEMLPQLRNFEEKAFGQIKEKAVELKKHKDCSELLNSELRSLRQRKSNVPMAQIAIRERVCRDLAIEEDQIPFVGELLRLADSEAAWEGAVERLLHNFALSMIVPDELYAKVAAWVDKTSLHSRLVYYRVKNEKRKKQVVSANSLVKKLLIKDDATFYEWLESELAARFDYACCENIDSFRRETQAITRNGQIKSGGQRHEKDDRHDLTDRSRYVLGWTNEAKIRALQSELGKIEEQIGDLSREIKTLEDEKARYADRQRFVDRLLVYEDFVEIDWQRISRDIDDQKKEQAKLESASDILGELEKKLRTVDEESKKAEKQLEKLQEEKGSVNTTINKVRIEREETEKLLKDNDMPEFEEIRARIRQFINEINLNEELSLQNLNRIESSVRGRLQARIDSADSSLRETDEKIVGAMQNYKNDYKVETSEFDARVEASEEYRNCLKRLVEDDLPSFEKNFKKLLNENTINEIANFNSQLDSSAQKIKERISSINRSLAEIPYNPGRYIRLEEQSSSDVEIRDFRQELRSCTENTLDGREDDLYAESRFLKVRQIIERFKGREGRAEADQKWMDKVTDVRNWFVFAASERYKEDDTEYEHYTDSGGKSGGQKEKLAYTVLAASLAYQFGLERGSVRSRSFRFVVIDEAFGRGSEESTRYALELFKKLNLQLLVVTPLQKIHVIEPYVESVGFVHSRNGMESLLRNLSIEDYRKELDARNL